MIPQEITDKSFSKEKWKQLTDVDASYYISNFGRVYRTKYRRVAKMRDGSVRQTSLKAGFLSGTITRFGYRTHCILGKKYQAHRMVAKYFLSNESDKPHVNHLDLNKINNHVSNLEWCTNLENRMHAKENGATARGELNHFSKLKSDDVINIRELLLTHSGAQIARMLRISHGTISNIKNGKSWQHVKSNHNL